MITGSKMFPNIMKISVSLLLSFENWSLSCKDASSIQIKTSFALWYSTVNSKVRMNSAGSYSFETLAVSKPHVLVIHVERNRSDKRNAMNWAFFEVQESK